MAGLESYRVGACRIIPALPTVTMENYLSVAVSGGLANINLTTHYPCFLSENDDNTIRSGKEEMLSLRYPFI